MYIELLQTSTVPLGTVLRFLKDSPSEPFRHLMPSTTCLRTLLKYLAWIQILFPYIIKNISDSLERSISLDTLRDLPSELSNLLTHMDYL